MSKIIVIDPNKCIGCQTCVLLNPRLFSFDTKTFKAVVKNQPPQITSDIKNTVSSCPVAAIKIK